MSTHKTQKALPPAKRKFDQSGTHDGVRHRGLFDTVLGFNKSGKEAVRQQVEEPIYIRPAERVNWL